ncbi:MAG: right-handed parallel beta-helix repeat-containing protein [Planctomycetes bacterium]|nr:right-handed parallel beta-helix repeat-containing protein [Planctomycetota bacterium]
MNHFIQRLWSPRPNSATSRSRGLYTRRIRLEPLEDRRLLATFVVQNTNNSGAGSLRQAILDANARTGADTIVFNIPTTDANFVDVDSGLPGGDTEPDVFVIRVTSALSALGSGSTSNNAVIVDGRTQTAFGGDTNPFGPEIVIDGNGISASAFTVLTRNTAVYGLNIQRFGGYGVRISDASDVIVAGNYIGTDATASSARGNSGDGIFVDGLNGSNARIGGASLADRNVISGNGGKGIEIMSWGAIVAGNRIGTDASGMFAIGNASDGVFVAAPNARIGGATLAERNVISGNAGNGIHLINSTPYESVVAGNLIGTDATGTFTIGNDQNGVLIRGRSIRVGRDGLGADDAGEVNVISGNGLDGVRISEAHHADDNRVAGNYIGTNLVGAALGNGGDGVHIDGFAQQNIIGGPSASLGNKIAFNGGSGVVVVGNLARNNTIRGNAIHDNGGLGIDLGDDGVTPNDQGLSFPNEAQDFPILYVTYISGATLTVMGTLTTDLDGTHTIEFFANTEVDPSGHGEGEVFLGTTTVALSRGTTVAFSKTLTGDFSTRRVISATATSQYGDTSEFSSQPTGVIIDDADAGFMTVGNWAQYAEGFVGRGGTFRYAQDHGGSDVAAWSFDVEPGLYQVAATWAETPFLSPQSLFSVLDGESPRGFARLNQQAAPDTFNDEGSAWEDFGGVYNILGNTLRIELTAQGADGRYVVADAIRIARVGDLPSGAVMQVFEGTQVVPLNTSASVSFGSIEHNRPQTKTFTVINSGTAELSFFQGVSAPTGFTVAAQLGKGSLNPGESTTFSVRLDGLVPGAYSGRVFVVPESPYSFAVTGTVLPTQLIDDGDAGFGTTNIWGTAAILLGWELDYRFSRNITGQDIATWTFDVAPGQYRPIPRLGHLVRGQRLF